MRELAKLQVANMISSDGSKTAECEMTGTLEEIEEALYSIITSPNADVERNLYTVMRNVIVEIALSDSYLSSDFWKYIESKVAPSDEERAMVIPMQLQ